MSETRRNVPEVNKQLVGGGMVVVILSAVAVGWSFSEGDTVTGLGLIAFVVAGLLYVGIGFSPSEQ